ncbi:flavin reductase [Micromonospora sp. NPDC049114]|uniref:flavin reductase n=1 Tax=unclassified Micromonospora TaxID=2617518 RepID=UPI0033DE061F
MSPRSRPHHAGLPHWRCTRCGAHWPCSAARLSLLARWRDDRVGMLLMLTTLAREAFADALRLGLRPDPAVYVARFLEWTRPRSDSRAD